MALLFVSYMSSDGPDLSWIVEGTEEQEEAIAAWLDRNHEDDDPFVGKTRVLSFEEFKTEWMDEEDEDDDDDDDDD